jgi:two-component system, LytTR family, response regulator
MKKSKAIIIDDEVKASENLYFLIENYCKEIEICAMYNHPLDALEGIKTHKPDLLFLDVEMPQLDGFQLLAMVTDFANPKVIFTTAYKEYALDAIKKSASDYLLKPIDIQELIKAVHKVSICISDKSNSKPSHIKIASMHGYDLFKVTDIHYLKSSNNVTEIFYSFDGVNKSVIATKPIKHFEDLLVSYSFFRIHDSFIINLNFIKQYVKGEGGIIVMQDGTEMPLSRRRKQDFLNLFLN